MKRKVVFFLVLVFSLGSIFSCEKSASKQFELLDASKSNIDFVNLIEENDSFNIIAYEHIYNGGGVALADFNNDGLQDIYFTANTVSNRLYLNRGSLRFEDVTEVAKVQGEGKWCMGVSIVDINFDGFKDIYVSVSTHSDSTKRENILYINQGLNSDGIPYFVNMASEYGVDDNSYTTNAAFFDYDNDGDLDLYLLVDKIEKRLLSVAYTQTSRLIKDRLDKLYKNDWSEELGHPVFTEVSKKAGVSMDGFGLGISICDLNKDGWKDIYISNDYLTQDLLYVNQQDGTFRNMIRDYLKHTSYAAMGHDIADFNNDGNLDIFVLDMLPEDNFRKKTMVPATSYSDYINNEKYGYIFQYTRNTLQQNLGINPETGIPLFSEIGLFAGISSTEWSWTPMLADFDNDGLRDLIITNGFPKDVTDRDYVEYQTEVSQFASMEMLTSKIPSVKIRNYAFKNLGNGNFDNVTELWGINLPSFSNGATYGDLDDDGDLDYVVNNINDPAFVYKNLSNDKKEIKNNWLKISLEGEGQNIDALGTIIEIFSGNEIHYWDHSLSRGYLSSIDENIIFGLGDKQIDSILVYWPNGTYQRLADIEVNQHITLKMKEADRSGYISDEKVFKTLFTNYSYLFDSLYYHKEQDFIDFNIQPLIPHKLSQYGPGISVGDVNNDGLEDMYISGPNFQNGRFLLQKEDGTFESVDLFSGNNGNPKNEEELGTLLFDADSDGDLDLYLVSGSYEFSLENGSYQDRIFENIKGTFCLNQEALPDLKFSGSCVKAADFDKDGDLDLFVGGRVLPHEYPKPVNSYVLENISSTTNGIKFIKADQTINDNFENLGLVTDALWTDFNNDTWVDLIVVGEWMPITFYQNEKGILRDISDNSAVKDKIGWWNSITSIDLDLDGDMDYVVGNFGTNSILKASDKYPISIYGNDFDGDKKFDAVLSTYFKNEEGEYEEFPFVGRVDFQREVTDIHKKFKKHSEFGEASIDELFTESQLNGSLILSVNYLQSSILENKGNGRFSLRPLPEVCQWAPIFGMVSEDFNGDNVEDIMMVGNDFGNELLTGRQDAFNGLVLLGDGKGDFESLPIQRSGVYVPGDAKALVQLSTNNGVLHIASQNRSSLKAFRNQTIDNRQILRLKAEDVSVSVITQDGVKINKEYYYGDSFLSQSSRVLIVPEGAKEIKITTFRGEERIITKSNL